MNVKVSTTGLIEWRPDPKDELVEVGWVGAIRAFRLRHFGQEGLRNFRHLAYTGYVDALPILKDGSCLFPLNDHRPGSHFTYFTDASEARGRCQRSVDAFATNFASRA